MTALHITRDQLAGAMGGWTVTIDTATAGTAGDTGITGTLLDPGRHAAGLLARIETAQPETGSPVDAPNIQLAGRNGRGEIVTSFPRPVMTREQALAHAAWLVMLADDNDEFAAYLAAVRNGG